MIIDHPGLLIRRWTTRLVPQYAREYEVFARNVSLPMFRRAPGCFAVAMSKHQNERTVTTIWRSVEDLTKFEASPDYQKTVLLITARGFLVGPQAQIVEQTQLFWSADQEPEHNLQENEQ